jgi:CheY-like chemotaxis protein
MNGAPTSSHSYRPSQSWERRRRCGRAVKRQWPQQHFASRPRLLDGIVEHASQRQHSHAALAASRVAMVRGPVPQPPTILVVEDEQDQMTILTLLLTGAGYRVLPAFGADDAIRKVKTQPVDLVLTDLAMPKVSGVEVVYAIKSDPQTQHIPVVVITAYVWESLGRAASQMRPDAFISKPYKSAKLLDEVRLQLGNARR